MQLPKMPSFSLKGQSALIVGASSGIGTACAVALAEHGAKVTLAARRKDKLEILAHQMEKKEFEVKIIELDINDITKTSDTISKLETFDILVNSAGIAKHSASVDTLSHDFDEVMSANLRGAYFLTQAVAKKLISESK